MSLVLHKGAHRVSRLDLMSVETPAPTETWAPVPHLELVDQVLTRFAPFGYTILKEEYGLWRGGARFFGVLTLGGVATPADYALALGIRNSHDQSMSAGLAVGSNVFVCDNLAFSGEVTMFRKHTSGFHADLPGILDRVMARAAGLQEFQDRRIASYKETDLSPRLAHDLVIRALDRGVVSGAQVPVVLGEYRKPRHEAFAAPTVWSLFNAFTEVLKSSSRLALPRRTIALHAVCDEQVGLLPAPELAPSAN